MTEREDIADERESRERFEKDLHQECRLIEARVAAAKRYTDGIQIILTFAKEIREQAERDTRERCVEQVLALRDKTSTGAYWEALNTVAEAIRKGGE